MSFILDALKKSENERQRTIGPSLADAPMRSHRSERPWWAFAVAALLVVNLGVLVIVLTRNNDSAETTPAATQPVPVTSSSPPATRAPVATPAPRMSASGTSPAVRSLAEEAGTYPEPYPEDSGGAYVMPGNPDLAAAANVPAGPPIVRPIDAPAVAPLGSQPTFESRTASGNAAAATGANATSSEVLPTAGALTATGANLPDLRLDIHVYSTNPSERFVFVNMRKYHEGQAVSEGPTIERITPDGAVMNQQGMRYLLPRP